MGDLTCFFTVVGVGCFAAILLWAVIWFVSFMLDLKSIRNRYSDLEKLVNGTPAIWTGFDYKYTPSVIGLKDRILSLELLTDALAENSFNKYSKKGARK